MKLAERQLPSLPADRDAQDCADGLHARGRVCACCREASAAVARARAAVVCVRCGGDASACFYRPARRACPRRRSDGGNCQAQGERSGHPNIWPYSPNPPTRMQRTRPQRATEWFWRKCEHVQERYRVVSPVVHPQGVAPTTVPSGGRGGGELCSVQRPR